MKTIQKIMTAFVAVLFAGLFLTGCPDDTKNTKDPDRTTEYPEQLAEKILILQAYGSASNAAGATHSFVELYNITDKAVKLNGAFLYYAAGHRNTDEGWANDADKPWGRIALSGTIPAKGSFLILGQKQNTNQAGTADASRYQIPDGYGDINNADFILYNRAFKVVLIQGDGELTVQNPFDIDGNGKKAAGYIDMVGARNSDTDKIFGYETAPARCSASEAVRRRDFIDNNDNSKDFIAARYAATGAGAFTDEMLELRKPRNSRAGSWDPFEEPAPPEETTGLMILQIGAATDGNISKSFVELYNNSDSSVVLNGNYSLQYAAGFSTGGTGGDPAAVQNVKDGPWKKIDLAGTIPPYHSFLILGGADLEDRITPSNIVTPMVNPALSFDPGYGDMNIANFYVSNRAAKIVIMKNQTILSNDLKNPFTNDGGGESVAGYVDMVGVKNGNNDSILGFETALAPSFTKQVGVRRKNLEDTDNNFNDFETITYNNLVTRTGNSTSAISEYSAEHERYRPKNSTYGAWDPTAEVSGVRTLTFSHDSGLYPQSFQLTLTAQPGAVIYYSIDGSVPLPAKVTSGGPIFEYSSPVTVQNRNGQPNLLATQANSAKFYLRPGDSRGNFPDPYYPTAAQVQKATVIRALAVDSGGKQSNVLTRTYFIGDNLQRYGNHPVISFVTDPVNLLDDTIGIYVQGSGNKSWPNYNFNMKGRDWERETNLDFFDGSRNVAFSTGAGIRIRGGWSRDKGQKSFNVYFRDEYGINNLSNYPLIPGAVKADRTTQVTTFKNFMLRNGGNDTEYTKFYDVFVQSLVSDRSFTTQTAIPCVVYLNGEYWGFYNLQEKYSNHYLEQKFGVNRDNVISVETGELDEGVESDMQLYYALMNYQNSDMSGQATYDAFCNVFDIQNFIDYFAANFYVYNEDWPHNNYQLWRVRDVEPGNPYGDGKWRWMMFDTEFSMGIYRGGGVEDPFNKTMNGDAASHGNAKLFKQLIKNSDFRRQFVLTMMDLYNVNFEYNSVSAKLTAIAAIYKPLMEHYYERWGLPWGGVFDGKTNEARNYLQNIRTPMTNEYLPRYFTGLGTLYNVSLSAKCNGANVSGASLKINTVTPTLTAGTWTGKYYSGYPVTVTANVPAGYEFSDWTVTGGTATSPSAQTTEVNITGNVQITANYSLK